MLTNGSGLIMSVSFDLTSKSRDPPTLTFYDPFVHPVLKNALQYEYMTVAPCSSLTIALRFRTQRLVDRPASRCRTAYPVAVRAVTDHTAPLSRFAPHLLYSFERCQDICRSLQWERRCGCIPDLIVYELTNRPGRQCDDSLRPCSHTAFKFNNSVKFNDCDCHPACLDRQWTVAAQNRLQHAIGKEQNDMPS